MWVGGNDDRGESDPWRHTGCCLLARGLPSITRLSRFARDPRAGGITRSAGHCERFTRRGPDVRSKTIFPDEATSGYRMKGFGFRDHPSPRLQSRAVRWSRSDSSAHLNPGGDWRSDHDLLETGGRRLQADPLGLRQGVTGTTVAAALRMKRRGRTRVAVAPPITRVRQHQAPSPLIRVNSPQ